MKKLALAALLTIAVTTPALADTVHLFDGSSYRGIITKQDDNSVTLKTSVGEMNFLKGRVSRISFDDKERVERDDEEEAPRVTRKTRKRRAYAEHKDPNLACCLSCVFPGVGQMYNGDWGSGLLCCGTNVLAGVVYLGAASATDATKYNYDPGMIPVALGVMTFRVGLNLYSMYDAHNKANEINRGSDDEANLSGVMLAEGIL